MLRFDSSMVLDGHLPGVGGAAALARPDVYSRQLHQVLDSMQRQHCHATGERYDASSTLLAQREVEQVLAQVLRTQYAPRYADRYIPMEQGGVSPFAERYIQKRLSRTGMADYVNSAQMPEAGVDMEEIPKRIRTIGIKFGWSWFEMQQAMLGMTSLSTEKAEAAREGAADAREAIMIAGDAALNTSGLISTGLINDPTVPTTNSVGGAWSGLTPDQIITSVRSALSVYRANSRRRFVADTLLLPETQLAQIETQRLTDTGVSVRQYLLANIAGLQTIDVLPDLAGAGAGATDRAIFYARNPMVVRGVVPMPFGFVAPQEHNLEFQNFGVERIAGVEFRHPFGALYIDQI